MERPGAFSDVLAAAQRNEDWAVTVIYRELHPPLARYLNAQEPRAAEDLEAEVWLAFAQGLHAFEGDGDALRAWVFVIARNRLADHRRTGARRRTDPSPLADADRPDPDEPETIVLDGIGGEEAAAFVTRSLPKDQADVVLLRIVAGLDVETVARMLGKRPGTVRVLQHRALRRLERLLTGNRVTR